MCSMSDGMGHMGVLTLDWLHSSGLCNDSKTSSPVFEVGRDERQDDIRRVCNHPAVQNDPTRFGNC